MTTGRHSILLYMLLAISQLGVLCAPVLGDDPRPSRRSRATRGANTTAADEVQINYPEAVSLAAFVDYVSQSLEIPIAYGDELRNQTVVLRPSSMTVRKKDLLDLLRSTLRMRELALVEGDMEGWLRIIDASEGPRYVTEIRTDAPPGEGGDNRIVSQVVYLKRADLGVVARHVRSFLSSGKASLIEVPESNLLIITDYDEAVTRAAEIIRLLDEGAPSASVEVAPVAHADPAALAAQVTRLVAEKARVEGRTRQPLVVQPDASGAGLFLIGDAASVAEARDLVTALDHAGTESETRTYRPQYISADRLQTLVENLILGGEWQEDLAGLFLDEASNSLYVTAALGIHDRVDALMQAEDRPLEQAARAMRVYRPRNRSAGDILDTLRELLITTAEDPGEAKETSDAEEPAADGSAMAKEDSDEPELADEADAVEAEPGHATRVTGLDFSLTLDEPTNSIVAVGSPEFHTQLEGLLVDLDRRRPQVLIEMTLVALTFNDSMSWGVELANEEMPHDYQSLLFSSFGLSSIDLSTGARMLTPGLGANGVLLGPHETPIVLRAVAARGDSRVITTPKIIVSDNTTSTVSSVEESPYTSVNASTTVATTSFAGFESAGTTLTVTPHIAAGDHMQLDYSFNFSNFTGSGSGGIPPPRSTNSFSGTVDVPDGYTVVVGGLVTDNEADAVSEVPLLGRVPVIGALFQSSSRTRTRFRTFAFIKVTILRDDQFADLKWVTEAELERASMKDRDYPTSEELWMR